MIPIDAVTRAAAADSVILIGARDTGKTAVALQIIRAALQAGRTVAFVDADVASATVGPPTCAGLKLVTRPEDLDSLEHATALHFVGSITPERLVLQQVIATVALADEGRRRADLVVVETGGSISGVAGETLKYHKVELLRPDLVITLQRGGELEPIVGMLRRFLSAEVLTLPADQDVVPSSPDEAAARRAERLAEAFTPPLETWRVRPTVFAPTLPLGLDLLRLDGVLVGIQDSVGHCLGLGRLEHEDGNLKVVTNAGEGMHGLRLGSVRIDLDTFTTRPINLGELIFGV